MGERYGSSDEMIFATVLLPLSTRTAAYRDFSLGLAPALWLTSIRPPFDVDANVVVAVWYFTGVTQIYEPEREPEAAK